ncbi:unnamed protein product [Cuscuta epithymum]|uniref:Uncharacterized protein n=1 Tax=Cuscuta epithymum TaxID=186058 RepID=A0AAV0DPE5_9ASTE|nr:unnamed protein product [Cuscuta epithymum]
MRRIVKVRYFPNSEFLKAKLGNNSSSIWRSIFETQDILRKNIRRRVGHGRDVQVWADAWLPGPGDGKIHSAKPVGIADMNVAALRDFTVFRKRKMASGGPRRKMEFLLLKVDIEH